MVLLNLVVLMSMITVFSNTTVERKVGAAVAGCGPVLLALTAGTCRVLHELAWRAAITVPVVLSTVMTIIQAFFIVAEVKIWFMREKPLRFAEIKLTVLTPAVAGGVTSDLSQPKRTVLSRIADWHNRFPAPRLLRAAVGCVFAAVVLFVLRIYGAAGWAVVYAVGAICGAALIAKFRRH